MNTENTTINYMNEQYLKKSAHGELYKLWGSKEVQLLRFKVLSELGNFDDKSILDVGCGLGEFYYFCKERRMNINEYVGIEM